MRTAPHPGMSIRPRLSRDPFQSVETVLVIVVVMDVVPFRGEGAARILHHRDVTRSDLAQSCAFGPVLVVRCAKQKDCFPNPRFSSINVGCQMNSVAHGNPERTFSRGRVILRNQGCGKQR